MTQTYQQRMSILDEIGRQRTAEYGGAARKDIRALPEKVDENTPKFAIDFLDYYDTVSYTHLTLPTKLEV